LCFSRLASTSPRRKDLIMNDTSTSRQPQPGALCFFCDDPAVGLIVSPFAEPTGFPAAPVCRPHEQALRVAVSVLGADESRWGWEDAVAPFEPSDDELAALKISSAQRSAVAR